MKNSKKQKTTYLLISLILLAIVLVGIILFLLFKQNRILEQSSTTSDQQRQLANATIQGPFSEEQIEDGFTSDSSDDQNEFFGPEKPDSSDNSQMKTDDQGSDNPSDELIGPLQPSQAPAKDSPAPSKNPSDKATDNATDSSSVNSTDDTEQSIEDLDRAASGEGTISPSHGSSAFDDRSDEALNTVTTQVEASLPTDNGSWSVYICDLSSGTESTINDVSMQAASLIKLYIMGAVYENYDTLSQQYGADTLNTYLTSMITVSDNDAANSLVSCLGNGDSAAGMQKVNSFCQSHGYHNTSMGRLLLASNEFGDNYTSAYDCGKFLKEIYQICAGTTQTPSLTHAEDMYALLKQQQRTNKIPAALPEGVHVANKTGELSDVENDAGILYDTAKGKDLVICFLSENLRSAGDAQNTIAQLSRTIYLAYNQ